VEVRRLAFLAILLPATAVAGDPAVLRPFATATFGIGFAQDNATLASAMASADVQGAGSFGPLLGASLGLDVGVGDLFTGARVGWQYDWIRQSLDASLATGESIRATGSLDQSVLLLGRLGWTVSSVPVYLTGGWAWSWASTTLSIHDLGSSSQTVSQDGGVVGAGVQPGISEHWFLELEYLLVLYRQVAFSTPLDAAATTRVRSIASSFGISVGYRL
jgi:opacity protein-like surface antigen